MTTFSETGYVGEDTVSILSRAVCTYGAPIGELAAVVLDEIDKIADGGIGGGHTMVSRHGVQRSLLKLLEPGIVEVPAELARTRTAASVCASTRRTCCGSVAGPSRDSGKRTGRGGRWGSAPASSLRNPTADKRLARRTWRRMGCCRSCTAALASTWNSPH